MKKYSVKKYLISLPNFDSEINGFVAKFDILNVDQKKELKEILKFHFKNISKYGIDMWHLKQRLDESMQRVNVIFLQGKDMADDLGSYDFFANEMQIRTLNASKQEYFATIVHELTHCLSSSRQIYKNRPNYQSDAGSTGFLTYYETLSDDKYEQLEDLTNSRVLTEAITEYLTLETMNEYYGCVYARAYVQEQKILNQLKTVLGSEIIKAYFDNNSKVFENFFELTDEDLANCAADIAMSSKIGEYLQNVEYVMNTNYGALKNGRALYSNDFFNINLINLQIFQTKIVSDLLKNMDMFQNGMDVKKAILNSFTMYASNVFFGYTIPNERFLYDFWNMYADTVVNTIEGVKETFEQKVGVNIPSVSDPELLEYLFFAKCLCFKNYGQVFPLTGEIKVVEMQDFPVKKYLPKDLNVKNKYMKQLRSVIFTDITIEYFDEQQYYGSTCYDDVNQALKELELLKQYYGYYFDDVEKEIKPEKKSNQNFEN